MKRLSFGISLAAMIAAIPHVILNFHAPSLGPLPEGLQGSSVRRRKVRRIWQKARAGQVRPSQARRSKRRKAARKAASRRRAA